LFSGLGRELVLWQQEKHRLTVEELTTYREALLDAIQGMDEGAGVLEKMLVRLGKG